MKTYIKPNMILVQMKNNMQLLNMSGGGEQIHGGYNGNYTSDGGITLGGRDGWFDEDEE